MADGGGGYFRSPTLIGLSRGVSGNQGIQLFQQSLVALARIVREGIAVLGNVVEERFDPLLVEVLPVGSIAGFFEPVSVENLLELVTDGHREIRLRQVQGLSDEGEAGIGDDRAGAGEVGEESIERRLFIEDIAVRAFPVEAVGNESTANRTQELGQGRCGRSHVDENVVAFGGFGIEDLLAQKRRKQERVALANGRAEETNDQIGVGARGHQPGDQFGGGGIAAVLLWIRDNGIRQAVLVIDGDDRKPTAMSKMASERLEVGDDQLGVPFIDEMVEAGDAAGGLRNGDQVLCDCALVADAVVDIGKAESVDLGDIELRP